MSLLPLWFVAVALIGLAAGGFINYCALRLPYERSLIWPRPRCLSCFQPVSWFHCLPLVGFAVLGGKCRTCRAPIPRSYPVVEVITAALFVALFALVAGVLELPLGIGKRWDYHPDDAPGSTLAVFAHYAVLLGFLLVASLCDLNDMEIPFTLTLGGTFVGLAMATLSPWPYPAANVSALAPPYPGIYPWPLWEPQRLREWGLPPGSPQLGFATGLAGALAGMVVLRGVRFLFGLGRGLEGMGVGDADLMMMAGAFVGWQPVVLAFFVAVFPGLAFAIVHLIARGSQALPFGPSLALGVVLTVLVWPVLGPAVVLLFFSPTFLGVVVAGGAIALLVIAFVLRLFRWLVGGGSSGASNGAGS